MSAVCGMSFLSKSAVSHNWFCEDDIHFLMKFCFKINNGRAEGILAEGSRWCHVLVVTFCNVTWQTHEIQDTIQIIQICTWILSWNQWERIWSNCSKYGKSNLQGLCPYVRTAKFVVNLLEPNTIVKAEASSICSSSIGTTRAFFNPLTCLAFDR